jgi:hypothetical protein
MLALTESPAAKPGRPLLWFRLVRFEILKQRGSGSATSFLPIDAEGSVLDIAKRGGLPHKGEPLAFRRSQHAIRRSRSVVR